MYVVYLESQITSCFLREEPLAMISPEVLFNIFLDDIM